MYANIAAMKRSLHTLTRRQKTALALVAIANVAVLALAVSVLRGSSATASPLPVANPQVCSDIAARLLARQNMPGWASIGPDNALRLQLTGLDSGGQPLAQPSDAAWDALAAMLSLPSVGCGPYPLVQVDVPFNLDYANGISPATRLLVSADWLDLRAWGYGELDDDALAQRLETTLYTQPLK